ncbi:hypothetical protein Tco_1364080, partial [Tanacetum coccineum]
DRCLGDTGNRKRLENVEEKVDTTRVSGYQEYSSLFRGLSIGRTLLGWRRHFYTVAVSVDFPRVRERKEAEESFTLTLELRLFFCI